MNRIYYIIRPSFSPCKWSSVEMQNDVPVINMCTFDDPDSSFNLLFQMRFDYLENKKESKTITRKTYDKLQAILSQIQIPLNDGAEIPLGIDGTLRQLVIHNGIRMIGLQWWEDEIGKWNKLSEVNKWFLDMGVA